MTHKTIMRLMMVLLLVSTFCGCPNDNGTDSGTTDNNNSGTKITSLKAVIDNAAAGSTIDLSQYSSITDYDTVINKAVTITNGSLGSGNLTITSGGVELSNVTGSANVTTNSSLKISSSSLSKLSVAAVSSPSANRILSRAGNVVTVEITNSVVSTVTMSISDSVLNVSGSESKIQSIEVKASVSIVLQNVNNNNITLPKAEDISQGVTITLTDAENNTIEIKGNKSEGDSSSSSSSSGDDSSSSSSDGDSSSSSDADDSSSSSSSSDSGDSSSSSSNNGDDSSSGSASDSSSSSGDDSSSSSSSDPTTDTVSGNISFGDDPMLCLVMRNEHTGNKDGDSWTFDLTSDLGVDVSGWSTTYTVFDYKLTHGSHDLTGMGYGNCVKSDDSITFSIDAAGVSSVLEKGYYQLFISVPVILDGSDTTFTVAGTFELYVE